MKTMRLTRTLFAPALLAAAIAPLALSASAAPGEGEPHGRGGSSHAEQREALFERAGLDAETRDALAEARAEHRQALQALKAEHRERLEEILDADQRAALEQAKREMRREWRAEQRQARAARLEALFDEWQLDETTHETLREQRAAFHAEAQALRDQPFDSREDRRSAWRELRAEYRETLAEQLDEEQLRRLREAMRPAHKGSDAHHGGDRPSPPDAG
ncbi:hypothetical protein [Halomonas nitroreducens]|uniref:DUF3106 domain-containing protein n=1 Tax=Halomonas nitroreducens TaxID=447425 RepID=A0A3S0JZ93_9GAMM|nr:hypothetical protein [Halomonas nitroreducens]RTR07069.1 hypothetical protein EKG36_01015 [Halomonas nitroreducens]